MPGAFRNLNSEQEKEVTAEDLEAAHEGRSGQQGSGHLILLPAETGCLTLPLLCFSEDECENTFNRFLKNLPLLKKLKIKNEIYRDRYIISYI